MTNLSCGFDRNDCGEICEEIGERNENYSKLTLNLNDKCAHQRQGINRKPSQEK